MLSIMIWITAEGQCGNELYGIYQDSVITFYYGTNPISLSNAVADSLYNIKTIVFDSSVRNYKPTTCRYWFENCYNLEEIIGLEYLNTENVTDMCGMFAGCVKLKKLDLSSFNTANVTNMSYMFEDCTQLESVNLSSFNTVNVTDMSYMFAHGRYVVYPYPKLKILDLSNFDTRNVTNMTGMFYDSNLKTIYVSEKWNTDNVKQSTKMFDRAYVRGGMGTHHDYKIEDVQYARIDRGVDNPGYFTDIAIKNATKDAFAVLKDSTLTLYYNVAKPLNAVIYHFGEYSNEECVKRIVFDESFRNCTPLSCEEWFNQFRNLKEIIGMAENLNTSNCGNMSRMFFYCANLETLDLSGFDTRNVGDMSNMFSCCTNLRTIFVGDNWSTKSLKQSYDMFYGCKRICGAKGTRLKEAPYDSQYAVIDGVDGKLGYLTRVDQKPYLPKAYAVLEDSTLTLYYGENKPNNKKIYFIGEYMGDENRIATVVFDKSFKNYYPTSCAHWFEGLKNLKIIRGMKEYLNTQYVVYMDYMFADCENLDSLDLSSFHTSRTKYMGALVQFCQNLKYINLSSFNTANVYDMSRMFYGCSSLEILDLSSFNTQKVKWTNFMFYRCFELKNIFVSDNWRINDDNMYMFSGCYKLRGGQGYSRHNWYMDSDYAHIDGGKSNPGLLTKAGQKPYKPKEYAVLIDSTLTFYYGENVPTGTNVYVPGCYRNASKKIKHVIFDESFKKFAPLSCSGWFCDCDSLIDIKGLEYLNTQNVVDMSSMFESCRSLKILDLSGFDTHNVTDMRYMFRWCDNLKTIYVGDNWNTNLVKNAWELFYRCSVVGGEGTYNYSQYRYNYDMLKYARIDGGRDNPGLFTRADKKPISLQTADSEVFISDKVIPYVIQEDSVLTFYYGKPKKKTECIENWKVKIIVFDSSYINYYPKSCEKMFSNYYNLTGIIGMERYLNTDSVTSMESMFRDCRELIQLNLSNFNTSLVTNMNCMFCDCNKLKTLDLSSFDTRNVVTTGSMFVDCYCLEELNLSNFNTESDTIMSCMFLNCVSLQNLDIQHFTTNNVKEMNYVFAGCENLRNLDLSSFNTSNVTEMHALFTNCRNITELDLSNFDTRKVKDMGVMFAECTNLQTIYVSDTWSVNSLDTTMDCYSWFGFGTFVDYLTGRKCLFNGCISLVGGNGTAFNLIHTGNEYAKIDEGEFSPGYFTLKGSEKWQKKPYVVFKGSTLTFYYGNKPEGAYNLNIFYPPEWQEKAQLIKKVVFHKSFAQYYPVSCAEWFSMCTNLTEIVGMKENLKTDSVTDMSAMFSNCFKLRNLDLSGFNTSNVTSMKEMFYCCESLESIDFQGFNTQNVKTMSFMFYKCKNLKDIHLDGFNTTNAVVMYKMFGGCSSIEQINLSSFDFSNNECVNKRNLAGMFEDCANLKELDLSTLTINNASIKGMFLGCSSLEKIKLFKIDPMKVDEYQSTYNNDMSGLFCGCKSLKVIDLSTFHLNLKPNNTSFMFAECNSLETIYTSDDWTVGNDKYNPNNMFKNCYNLIGGQGTKWDCEYASNLNFMSIDKGVDHPGFFTLK